MALEVVPMSIQDANAFVAQVHRHHKPTPGGLFALGAARVIGKARLYQAGRLVSVFPILADEVCAVAIVGRPPARMLQDGWTAEVTRLATDGTRDACSLLYGAAWRAARALGWRRLVTYTLPAEGGASLRAAGWKCLGEAGGGSWSRKQRPRVDKHPTQVKLKWEAA